jgi:hypothetical protein
MFWLQSKMLNRCYCCKKLLNPGPISMQQKPFGMHRDGRFWFKAQSMVHDAQLPIVPKDYTLITTAKAEDFANAIQRKATRTGVGGST